MMLNAKLGEVLVVTREKLLVGTISIEAIAWEGKEIGVASQHLTCCVAPCYRLRGSTAGKHAEILREEACYKMRRT